ncbi:MAG: hypothetical protein JXB23_07065 [Candidatus Aminicenantes bacterium]|nr:hypothetical protein [Candidatus Aminicenantes bacterium]
MSKKMGIIFLLMMWSIIGISAEENVRKSFGVAFIGGGDFAITDLAEGWKVGFDFGGRGLYHLSTSSALLLDVHYFSFFGKNSYYSPVGFFTIFGGYRAFLQKKASGFYVLAAAGICSASDRKFYYSGYSYGYYSTISSTQKGGVFLGFMAGAGMAFPLGSKLKLLGEVKFVGNTDILFFIPVSLGVSMDI